jgi:hypothetical protein
VALQIVHVIAMAKDVPEFIFGLLVVAYFVHSEGRPSLFVILLS